MPPTSCKQDRLSKTAARGQPYNVAQRNYPSTRYTNPRTLPSHPAPSTPSSTRQPAQPVISTTTASATQPRTWSSSDEISLRESCLSNVLGWKPDYVHKDDLVTFLLAHWKARPVNPTEADIKEYIELSLKSHHATPIQLRRTLQKSLDMKLIRPTTKPRGASPHVYTQKIPDSAYSIRLFPGAYTSRQWGMDFVNTASGEPVNSPFKYELWSVPSDNAPFIAARRIHSIEKEGGFIREAIRPGGEKFLLTDGQTYQLRRPGRKNVRFQVPERRELQVQQTHGDKVLQFPKVLYP